MAEHKILKKNIEKILVKLRASGSRFKPAGRNYEQHTDGPPHLLGKYKHDVINFKSKVLSVHVDVHNLTVSIQTLDKHFFLHPNQALVEDYVGFFKLLGEYQTRMETFMDAQSSQQQFPNSQNPNVN